MDVIAMLEPIFRQYLDEIDQVMRTKKFGDGLFGMPGGPKDDPCHDHFDKSVSDAVKQLVEDGVSGGEAAAAVEYLLHSQSLDQGVECAYWMLLAVHRHSLPLIPLMAEERAKPLLDWYTAVYPRAKRFPVQNDVIKALKRRAK